MKKLIFALLLACLPFSNSAFAADTAAVKTSSFKIIHANDLEQLMKAEASSVHVFDANDDDTRKSDGMIPSAKPLASSSHYDVATLPTDKNSKLVFYCYNTSCSASHDAAKVAMKAGYTNVYVMTDGIDGWKKAGKPTQKFDKKG